jgi:hypothetical protein
MYCPSCGVAVARGLTYCNYCGAKLSGEKTESLSKSSEVRPEMLVSAMVAVFVLGLGVITILMGMMKAVLGLNADRILGVAGMAFLILLLLEGVFTWMLLRRNRGAKPTVETALLKEQVTKELEAKRERLLPEPASVTENTTRTFAPIPTERKSE